MSESVTKTYWANQFIYQGSIKYTQVHLSYGDINMTHNLETIHKIEPILVAKYMLRYIPNVHFDVKSVRLYIIVDRSTIM